MNTVKSIERRASNREINTLSFFRGIAALYVMIAHVLIWGGYKGYFPNPKVAVDVFIFISGFLIVYGITSGRYSVSGFHIKRFFRIAPTYYFILLVIVALYPFINEGLGYIQSLDRTQWPINGIYDANNVKYDLHNVLMHISFLFGLYPDLSQSSYVGDWSLSLEMQFYLLAPLLFISFNKIPYAVAICISSVVIAIFSKEYSSSLAFREPSLIIFKIHLFMLGAITFEAIRSCGLKKAITLLLAFAIITAQYWIQSKTYLTNNSSIYLAIVVISMMMLKMIDSFFDRKIIHFFAKISYPLYLVHSIFIAISGYAYSAVINRLNLKIELLPFVATLTIPLSIYSAHLISKYVEAKGIDLSRKLTKKREA